MSDDKPTSGFLLHNKKHTSISSLHKAQGNMWLFIYEDIMGNRSAGGVAMYRGTAAEAGATLGLMNADASVEDCQQHALKEFDRLSALSSDPKREHERDGIAGIVQQALEELRPYGKPSHVQQEIFWQHPDVPVPFKGFIDFMWQDHGILLDMKTQLRLSSEVSVNHARQVSLYGAAISDNLDLRVGYFTPKKRAVYKVENARDHLNSLVKIAQTVDRFLALSADPHELLRLCIPDPSSFYFSDPNVRQRAFELSGI